MSNLERGFYGFKQFDNIFDELLFGFGKPRKLSFCTPYLKDITPSHWRKTDTGYKATCRSVGISECDIKVELEDYGIKLSGESEIDGVKYSTYMELPISDEILSDLLEIKTTTQNGITIIELILDKPKKKLVKINGK